MSDSVMVTGAAGFIGMHTCARLLAAGRSVTGVDNLSPYYDVNLKRSRLSELRRHSGFRFVEADLANARSAAELFTAHGSPEVIHLAAQPGVRHSISHPRDYLRDNIDAFLNVLEGCRAGTSRHLVYASSSSVYGATHTVPFSEDQSVDRPVSLYAATKKADELFAHAYSHLYGIPTTGLRFFTVYGPWGRPDMSPFLFTRAILAGEPIKVFNQGRMQRDFTYIDDIVEGVLRTLARPPDPDPVSGARWAIYNIGNHQPVELETFIATLESALGRKAIRNYLPMQAGDVTATFADTTRLSGRTGFAPSTPLAEGLARFVTWYREYYGGAG